MDNFNYKQPLSKDMKINSNQLSDTQVKPTEPINNVKKKTLYRCTNCGIVHECDNDKPPKSCLKCDNDRFDKVKK